MKIVVIGGTGLIGSKVVEKLKQKGHQALAAAPSTGVNTITGQGLAEAFAGAEVVVDVSNSPSFDEGPAMEFFRTAHDPMLEAYTTLGFLAGATERVKLGTVVTGVTYRHPGLLAKTVTTLDVLSGGRAQLGIGAAWFDREHEGLGVPFPPLAERFE